MAEVVGAISGAITIGALAANVAMSVAKLKSYWDLLEDAPDDIERLIDEIEILSLILDDIKDDQTRNPISSLLLDGTSLSRCLENCNKAAKRLRQLTDEMGKSIDTSHQLKKKWAAAKVLLKKDKIEKFKVEMESAIRLLSLSHQSYTRVLLRLQPDIIVARVSEAITPGATAINISPEPRQHVLSSLAPPSQSITRRQNNSPVLSSRYFWQSSSTFNALGSLGLCVKRAPKSDGQQENYSENVQNSQEIAAFYRGPAWLVNRAWMVYATKAFQGWDFSIRQYNVIPRSSEIFEYSRIGNVLGIQELFDRGEASPYDCDQDGWTPLQEAAYFGVFSTCKLLISLGADANYHNGRSSVIQAALWNAAAFRSSDDVQEALDTSRLLLSKAEIDPHELGFYQGPKEGFSLWQQHIHPEYYESSLEDRFQTALTLASVDYWNNPMLLRMALSRGDIPHLAVNLRGKNNVTLLHVVGRSIGILVRYIERCHIVKSFYSRWVNIVTSKEYLADWRLNLKEMIYKGADLHAITLNSHTPLIYLLSGVFGDWIQDFNIPRKLLCNFWLSNLMECGIDLYAYGKQEVFLHESGLCSWDFKGTWNHRGHTLKLWRLVNFTYGSSPSDWNFVVEKRIEEADEDYDQMGTIPGGWVEE